jgi:hypothetical protein
LPETKAGSDPVVGLIVTSGGKTRPSSSFAVGRRPSRLDTGMRAEQQAFAEFKLDFAVVRSLPEKLKRTGPSLP